MKYIKWFFMAIIDILFNVICYVTNPFVLLFADELGNLPHIFRWWENWDDHIDVEWMVTEHHVPSWAEYDFDRHYRYYTPQEAEQTIGVHRGYVILLDPCFTRKERIQRYICRLVWIYRNCGYGFSYWVTGIDVNEADIVKKVDEYGHIFYVTDDAFCYKDERPSFGAFHWDNYVGWKFRHCKGTQRCMLACRINPFAK